MYRGIWILVAVTIGSFVAYGGWRMFEQARDLLHAIVPSTNVSSKLTTSMELMDVVLDPKPQPNMPAARWTLRIPKAYVESVSGRMDNGSREYALALAAPTMEPYTVFWEREASKLGDPNPIGLARERITNQRVLLRLAGSVLRRDDADQSSEIKRLLGEEGCSFAGITPDGLHHFRKLGRGCSLMTLSDDLYAIPDQNGFVSAVRCLNQTRTDGRPIPALCESTPLSDRHDGWIIKFSFLSHLLPQWPELLQETHRLLRQYTISNSLAPQK